VAHRTMEYTAIQKGRGLVYAANEQVYRRNSESNRVKYLVCINDDCKGTAKIEGSILKELNAHTNHGSMSEEISRLTLLARLRKRAAEESATTLRNIFDEETRASASKEVGACRVLSKPGRRSIMYTNDDVPSTSAIHRCTTGA
jgi:hypothetical protein